MALTNSNASAWLKTVFGPPVEVLPSEDSIAADIPLQEQEKTGDTYKFPIKLQHPQGFAYNSDHSAFTLPSQKDSVVKQASLEGAEILGLDAVSYGIASRMSEGKGTSNKAYKQAVGEMIEGLMTAGEVRREIALMYGPGSTGLANLGVVDTIVSAASTTLVVTLTRASYAPGMWLQLIGAGFDLHTSGGTSHTSNAELVLTAVNSSNGRLTFSGNSTDVAAAAVADVFTFRDSRTKSCVGLQAIMENTGSLFGIDAAVYPQWKCNQYAVGGPLTFDKLQEGLAQPSENGLSDGISVYLGARAWTDLMTDEAALRRHAGADAAGKAKAGYSILEFDSVVGKIKLVRHRFMKQGFAFGIPTQFAARVGSTDLTFSIPGSKNEWFWNELTTTAGSQIRIYSDQSIVLQKPNHAVLFTGVQSTADVIPA